MDQATLMLILAILPVILVLLFVYNKDKSKEPFSLLIQLFGLGIASCFLVLLVSNFLGLFIPFMAKDLKELNEIEVFLYAFFGIALVEEVCKWIMVYYKGYNHQEFDEVYDIIVYAVFVSLGFAFFENILYVFGSGSLATAILRAVSAIPGHACDAVFMGYFLSLAKQFYYKGEVEKEKKYIVLSIIVPAILHGIYDYCLLSGIIPLLLVFIIFVIFLYINSIKTLKKVSEENKRLIEKYNFCRYCGYKIEGDYCGGCGAKVE